VDVLVLTTARRGRDVLPGLELLPHRVATRRPSVHEYLTSGPCDAVMVDGRTHPHAACELSRRLAATSRGVPVIGVIEEQGAPYVDEDCAIVQLLLPQASPAEIDARLRLAQRHRVPDARPSSTLEVGPFTVDTDAYVIRLDGIPLRLTHHQYELLRALLKHAGRPLSRSALIAGCPGWTDATNPRAVDCHVRAVRAKLGPHRDSIRTVRGHGYLIPWSPPVQA